MFGFRSADWWQY